MLHNVNLKHILQFDYLVSVSLGDCEYKKQNLSLLTLKADIRAGRSARRLY